MMWTKGGNELIHTRYHAGYVYGLTPSPLGYIIPFKSTGHTVSKNWMSMMSTKDHPLTVKPYAAYTSIYELTTVQKKKANNQWFVVSVRDLGWVQNKEDRERGRLLHEAFQSGALRASDEDMASSARDASKERQAAPDENVPF
jgi:hypothetical protein